MSANCPICGAKAPELFISKHSRQVYTCGNDRCQHLFTLPIGANQGVHERPVDIETESDNSLRSYQERNTRLLQLFLSKLSPAIDRYRFLDFGAGDAHISRTFKNILQDKVEIYCVEAEQKCLPLYKKYGLQHVDDLEQVTGQIDLVYAIEVIEHVPDPIAVLISLKRLLRGQGQIFLSTPPGHVRENATNAYDNPTHLHFFTPRSLNLALVAAGLGAIDYRFYPEMYPLPGKGFWSSRMPSELSTVFAHGEAAFNKLANKYFNKMGMPVAADGKPYPYHLVGFTA
jgi:SAM-dependent methyltransferase